MMSDRFQALSFEKVGARSRRLHRLQKRRARLLHFESLESRVVLAGNPAAVSDTSLFPNRATVQIVRVWDTDGTEGLSEGDHTNGCSGALIGDYHVLTAAHCLYSYGDPTSLGYKKFPDWIFVHAGRDGRFNRPYGEASAVSYRVTSGWMADDEDRDVYDLGLITLDRNLGRELGKYEVRAMPDTVFETVTYLPSPVQPGTVALTVPFEVPYSPEEIEILHYPGSGYYSQVDQYYSDGPIDSTTADTIEYSKKKAWTTGGSSGAPLYINDTVGGQVWTNALVGVHVRGDRVAPGEDGEATAIRIDQFWLDWIADFFADHADQTVTDRPALVDFDSWFDKEHSTISDATPAAGQQVTINAKVFNAGTADAANVAVQFRLSTDNVFDASDTLLGSATIANLPKFATRDAELQVAVPFVASGTYFVVWSIDPANTVAEFDTRFNDLFIQPDGGLNASNFGELQIDVENRAPQFALASPQRLQTYEGLRFQLDVDATDPEGRAIQYALVAPSGSGQIDAQTGLVTWSPAPGKGGRTHYLNVVASDGVHFETLRLEVQVERSEPTLGSFTASHATIRDDGSELITLAAFDAEIPAPGQSVSYVDFYVDRNQNGLLDLAPAGSLLPGADELLERDTYGGNGWTWTGPIGGFAPGMVRVFARPVWTSEFYTHYGQVYSQMLQVVPAPAIAPIAIANNAQQVNVAEGTPFVQNGQLFRLASGQYVAFWSAGGSSNLRMRRYSATGSPLEAAVVLPVTAGKAYVRSDGQFLVSVGSSVSRFTAAGGAIGGAINLGFEPQLLAIADDGSFVAARMKWDGFDQIVARRFAWDGAPLTDEFIVLRDENIISISQLSDLQTAADGTFVAAWQQWENNGTAAGLWTDRARVFQGDGTPLTESIVLSPGQTNWDSARVSINDVGQWVALTESLEDSRILLATRYSLQGERLGEPFQVNTSLLRSFKLVAHLNDAGWLVVAREYEGRDVGDSSTQAGLYVQVVDDRNQLRGPEFLVPTVTVGSQRPYALASGADGDFAVLWDDQPVTCCAAPATSDHDLRLRTYSVNLPPSIEPVEPRTTTPGTLLQFSVAATDPEANGLSYSLQGSVPEGAVIDASTGLFSWTPTVEQVGQTYPVKIRVTDDGVPAGYGEQIAQVTVLHPDIRVLSAKAVGDQVEVEYEILHGTVGAFDLAFYRSSDAVWNASDEWLDETRVDSAAFRAAGRHSLILPIGSAPGAMALPGAGAAETDEDYYLLVTADPSDAISEDDATPVLEDNVARLSGVYHEPGGDVFVVGSDEQDTVEVRVGSVVIEWNGVEYTFPEANVDAIRLRLGGQDDVLRNVDTPLDLFVWGGEGADELIGGAGVNRIEGGPGADRISGSVGQDFVVDGGAEDGFVAPVLTALGVTPETRPLFDWDAVADAVAYDLQLARTDGTPVESVAFVRDTQWRPTVPLAGGGYRASVRAVRADRQVSSWSEPLTFTVDVPAPAAPSLRGPAGVVAYGRPTFEWNVVPFGATYELRLARPDGEVVWSAGALADAIYETPVPLGAGSYRAQVRAFNGEGDASPWSTPVEFSVEYVAPSAPTIRAPVGLTMDTTPALVWRTAIGVETYDAILERVLSGGSTQEVRRWEGIRSPDAQTAAQAVDAPLAEGDYRWRLRAVNGAGEAGDYATTLFTIDLNDAPPLPPRILETPANDSLDTLAFVWSSEPLALTYDLRIEGAGQLVTWSTPALNGSELTLPNKLLAGTYRAQVRVQNRIGASLWSDAVEFSLDQRGSSPQWQNALNRLDVNDDSFIAPIDALLLINELNAGNGGALDARTQIAAPFLDPSGDGFLAPNDALDVINWLNGGGAEGEFVDTLDDTRTPWSTDFSTLERMPAPLSDAPVAARETKTLGLPPTGPATWRTRSYVDSLSQPTSGVFVHARLSPVAEQACADAAHDLLFAESDFEPLADQTEESNAEGARRRNVSLHALTQFAHLRRFVE